MAHGGARAGAGRKPKAQRSAAKLIEALNRPAGEKEPDEVRSWRPLWEAKDLSVRLDARVYLYDKRDGAEWHRRRGPVRSP
jgi:hypothetical protein